MIAALDVHYDEIASSALAAAVVFQNWEDEEPLREYTVRCNGIAAYGGLHIDGRAQVDVEVKAGRER